MGRGTYHHPTIICDHYAGGVDEKWLDGPAMRMARAWFTLNTLGTTIGKNHVHSSSKVMTLDRLRSYTVKKG
jgi:hypothetical protein